MQTLIVEDAPLSRHLLAHMLLVKEIEYAEAENGQEALEIIKKTISIS